jgi:hypothetical protein
MRLQKWPTVSGAVCRKLYLLVVDSKHVRGADAALHIDALPLVAHLIADHLPYVLDQHLVRLARFTGV